MLMDVNRMSTSPATGQTRAELAGVLLLPGHVIISCSPGHWGFGCLETTLTTSLRASPPNHLTAPSFEHTVLPLPVQVQAHSSDPCTPGRSEDAQAGTSPFAAPHSRRPSHAEVSSPRYLVC